MIDLALLLPIIIAVIIAFCGIMATIETRDKGDKGSNHD